MKRKNPLSLLMGWLGLAFVSDSAVHGADSTSASVESARNGTIVGRVSNAATQANLEGAMVRLAETNQSTLTQQDGSFQLQAPAGSYSLTASYTGLDTQSAAVTVAPGATVAQDFQLSAEIYRMSAFTVSGEREGNALAITLQRHSDGVKNIVSADAFGNLAGNPADLVMRLPGVAGESVGGDTRYLRIRGMHYNLSSVSVDGNQIADAGTGTTREVQWQQVGTETMERVEVTKSPTPNLPSDSIGGAINIVSKNAFDRSPGRRLSGSFGIVWRPTDKRSRPLRQWTVSYSEVFRDRIGVSFNYGFQPVEALTDTTNQTHQNLPNDVDGPAYTNVFEIGQGALKRTRWGGGLRLDFKLSQATRFYADVKMNNHNEHNNNRSVTWQTAANVATVDVNGNFSNNNHIVPGYTDRMTEWRPLNNSIVQTQALATHKRGRSWNYQIGGIHRYPTVKLDYDIYHSTSENVYPGNKTFTFIARGIGMRIERTDDRYRPEITQLSGPDMTQISSYSDNTYTIARIPVRRDEFWGGALNLKRTFNTVVPTYLQAGLRTRERTRQNETDPWTGRYTGGNYQEIMNRDTLNVGHGGRYPLMPYPAYPGRDTPGSARNQYAGYKIDMLFRSNPELFVRNTVADLQSSLSSKLEFKERVDAAYVMGNIDLGRLTVLGGIRVEETHVEGEGQNAGISPEEAARRAAWTGPVTEAENIRRTLAQFGGRIRRTAEYRGVFPGVHFKYQIRPGLISRLSYATNIGRPNIGQLVPNTTVNFDARTVSTSNPGLKPQYADNFDLSLEYYFEPSGLVSAGVFLKEMKDFIFTQGGAIIGTGSDNGFGGLYEGYTMTTQYNGGSAKVEGIELSYSQQFTFLPGWLKGFGGFANYTWLKAEGDYGAGNAITLGQVNPHTREVPNFIPESGNAGISYIRTPISLRVQLNHVGRYLVNNVANRARLNYMIARSTVDIKFNYQVNRRLDFYLDINNPLGEHDRAAEYWGGRPNNMTKIKPQFFFGVRGRL